MNKSLGGRVLTQLNGKTPPKRGGGWAKFIEKLGQPDKAETAYGEAIVRFEKLIAGFTDLPQYRLEPAGRGR